MEKIRVMTIFGTRPEAIKMAPVVKLLEQDPTFKSITVVTAQHRQMLDQVLDIFDIEPAYDLDIMKNSQSLTDITTNILLALDHVLTVEQPDIILVHGDTSTTFAAALSAFYHQIPIGHVEAGLRTWDKYSPFPEEINRQLTDDLADLYFAPTTMSKQNLLTEHHPAEKIFITGNTAIDALKNTVSTTYHHDILEVVHPGSKVILVTMHRRENQGEPMKRAFKAIKEVVDNHDNVEVIFPVHLNPVVKQAATAILGDDPNIHLIAPLNVVDFHNLAARSFFIMTDSGGVQEEAPSLSKPVLVLRDTTERPEGITAGTLKLVGTDTAQIKAAMNQLLDDPAFYHKMATAKNPYGDGLASARIGDALKYYFKVSSTAPHEFE
jgi:UDP-N-acetylglucosamine 2-epimerase (non-hydrolysing)